jgi:hypothetical protein
MKWWQAILWILIAIPLAMCIGWAVNKAIDSFLDWLIPMDPK